MNPMMAKKNIFIERWSNAQYLNSKMAMLILIEFIVIIAMVLSLVWVAVSPRPIYYITSQGAGMANAGSAPESAVGIFAQSWLLNWTNFSSANVNKVYERSLQWMSPNLFSKTKQRFNEDIELTVHNTISSQFSLDEEPKVEKLDNGYQVQMTGRKNVFQGNQNVLSERYVFTLIIKRTAPTQSNPYGLTIDEIDQDIIK